MVRKTEELTQLLEEASLRIPGATERLIELVRDDLRRHAARLLNSGAAPTTLEPTALVHEVYLRIFGGEVPPTWENRRHFFMVSSRAMHDILVERARAASRKKRGGDQRPISLTEDLPQQREAQSFLELDEALETLSRTEPRRADIIRLRFYCQISNEEIAGSLGCSERTVRREWGIAKIWLREQLGDPLPRVPQRATG